MKITEKKKENTISTKTNSPKVNCLSLLNTAAERDFWLQSKYHNISTVVVPSLLVSLSILSQCRYVVQILLFMFHSLLFFLVSKSIIWIYKCISLNSSK